MGWYKLYQWYGSWSKKNQYDMILWYWLKIYTKDKKQEDINEDDIKQFSRLMNNVASRASMYYI